MIMDYVNDLYFYTGDTPETITPIPPSNPVLTETESKKRARSDSDNSEAKPAVEATAETPATEKKKKKKVFAVKSFPCYFELILQA